MQRYAMVATENGEELQTDVKGELIRVKDLIAWLDAQGDAAMEQARTLREGTDEHSTIGNVVQHYRFVATSLRLKFDDGSGTAGVSPAALSGYRLSRDYSKLFQLISSGVTIAAFVDYRFRGDDNLPPMRDICAVKYRGPWQVTISARGIGYGGLDPWLADRGEDEKLIFARICEAQNLEWIEP